MRIDKVNRIIAHNYGKPKQTNEPKLVIFVSISQEKLPHTLIAVIASTFCGKFAIPFFSGPPCVVTYLHERYGWSKLSFQTNFEGFIFLLLDVAKSLKDASASAPNLSEMISILNSAAELPCHTIKESGEEKSSITFSSSTEITQHIMSHGAVETKNGVKWVVWFHCSEIKWWLVKNYK